MLPSDPVHLAAGSALAGALLGLLRPLSTRTRGRDRAATVRPLPREPDPADDEGR